VRVLVTGATGFVGGNVARLLHAQGYQVRALARPDSSSLTLDGTGVERVTGDVRHRESVARALVGCQAVVHCAAFYSFWAPDPDLVYQVNVQGTKIVLEEALKAGVEKCVHTSTVSTVDIPKDGIGSEDAWPDPEHLVNHYKKSKYMAEMEALGMAAKGLPVVVVNPTTPVGPWDVKPTSTGRMVLGFIRGRIPAYLNTGMNLVDVEDVAMGHLLALQKGRPGQRYLLGSVNLTLAQVFGMLEVISGQKAPRVRLPTWLVQIAGHLDQVVEGRLLGREPVIPLEGVKISRKPMYVSCEKAVRELGMPQSPVEGALERAVRWFHDYGYVKGPRGAVAA
jgi:dihydroflavonol-4-reductase